VCSSHLRRHLGLGPVLNWKMYGAIDHSVYRPSMLEKTRNLVFYHLNKSTGDGDGKDVGVTGTGAGNITGVGLLCIESTELNVYTCVSKFV
jgi:hypothetical protein